MHPGEGAATLAFLERFAPLLMLPLAEQELLHAVLTRSICEMKGVTLDALFEDFLARSTVEKLQDHRARMQEFIDIPTTDLSHLRDLR